MLHYNVKYKTEILKDKISITKIGESLDIAKMLQRSAAGIIDLSNFQLPRSSDIPGGTYTEDEMERKKDELLNRPNSVMDNLFGCSVEQAEKEMLQHQETMRKNRKPKVEKKDVPKEEGDEGGV